MDTISVTVSTKDTEVLRKTAVFLQDLAGESVVRITGGPIEVEPLLDPETEALATGERIDAMVATAGAAELDIDGRPWDVRIDSSAKTKTTDGRWKIARNKDKALVEQVKAELSTPVEVPVVETPPAVVTAPAAVAPVVVPVVETPPVETPTVVAITTYVPLVNRITAMSQTVPPKLQAHDVMDALNSSGAFIAGATTLTELAKLEHAHLIPVVAAELEKLWTTRV